MYRIAVGRGAEGQCDLSWSAFQVPKGTLLLFYSSSRWNILVHHRLPIIIITKKNYYFYLIIHKSYNIWHPNWGKYKNTVCTYFMQYRISCNKPYNKKASSSTGHHEDECSYHYHSVVLLFLSMIDNWCSKAIGSWLSEYFKGNL